MKQNCLLSLNFKRKFFYQNKNMKKKNIWWEKRQNVIYPENKYTCCKNLKYTTDPLLIVQIVSRTIIEKSIFKIIYLKCLWTELNELTQTKHNHFFFLNKEKKQTFPSYIGSSSTIQNIPYKDIKNQFLIDSFN